MIECARRASRGGRLARLTLLALSAMLPVEGVPNAGQSPPPPTFPAWLGAVGHLSVPGDRRGPEGIQHYLEDCSATLVAGPGQQAANTVVTAWHCLADFRDLSRTITVTLPTISGTTLSREAYPVAQGGGMHADWAILGLHRPIAREDVVPLRIQPGRADRARPVAAAGYAPALSGVPRARQLNFDRHCNITGQTADSTDTDCIAFKGASGGAIVQRSATGEFLLCGVISEGDSNGYSRYVPVAAFRRELQARLRGS